MIKITLDTVYERDMDFMLIRKLALEQEFLKQVFLLQVGLENCSMDLVSVSHSVFTEEGETDIEVVLTLSGGRRVALLIEDKIDAQAMEQQADRYRIRGDKAV